MNLFVADPHWGWWIVFYFYLGGIAAGAYFAATLIDLFGKDADRELARLGYLAAFPLLVVCGVLLILDLNRPERFWHMLVRSELVHEALRAGWPWSRQSWPTMLQAPLLKYWSPMSIGSWALLLFGLCSSLSFLGSLWSEGRLQRWLRASRFGRLLQVAGCGVGFFVAAYTGVLLTATNQPLWSDTRWIGALFLTSAASTGLALLLFLGHARRAGEAVMHRLERADRWALLLELAAFAALLGSLGPVLGPVLRTSHGLLLVVGVLVIGIGAPFLCHLFSKGRRGVLTAAALVLAGGFVLRYAILSTPPELLVRGAVAAEGASTLIGKEHVSERMPRSPEDGRRSGAPGADPGNRPAQLRPRSKVFSDD